MEWIFHFLHLMVLGSVFYPDLVSDCPLPVLLHRWDSAVGSAHRLSLLDVLSPATSPLSWNLDIGLSPLLLASVSPRQISTRNPATSAKASQLPPPNHLISVFPVIILQTIWEILSINHFLSVSHSCSAPSAWYNKLLFLFLSLWFQGLVAFYSWHLASRKNTISRQSACVSVQISAVKRRD